MIQVFIHAASRTDNERFSSRKGTDDLRPKVFKVLSTKAVESSPIQLLAKTG
jgi:hypothetical protein